MMLFRRKRKQEFAKLARSIRDSVVTRQLQQEARELKWLTQPQAIADRDVVISLTSYSKRLNDVYLVLESIAQQTVLPNRVILWVSEEELTKDTLPLTLQKRLEFGLEIRFCRDIRSYKKLVPTLALCPDDIIITLDDDIIYPHDTIENLINEHQKHPQAILGNRAHEMTFNGNQLLPYKKWRKEVEHHGEHILLTGCGAILYPPYSLHDQVKDEALFMTLCPHADDIWFYAMAKLQHSEIRKASGRNFDQFVEIAHHQDIGLNKMNVDQGGNDHQLKAVIDYFQLKIKV
ncbi:TPA: glycosyl transferase [Vibrio cholerae]